LIPPNLEVVEIAGLQVVLSSDKYSNLTQIFQLDGISPDVVGHFPVEVRQKKLLMALVQELGDTTLED
jgi:hypothetical protein